MKPERWHQIQHLYNQALEVEESQRSDFLREACAGDDDLRWRINIRRAAYLTFRGCGTSLLDRFNIEAEDRSHRTDSDGHCFLHVRPAFPNGAYCVGKT